jgi:pyruvate formate lyase activating enzyme
LVSSISVSGGEPTLQSDLKLFLQNVRGINDKHKVQYLSIDTNGSNPNILQDLIPLLDRVALDIKAPLIQKKYEKITHARMDIENIKDSFFLLNSQKNIDFEIRATYVKNLLKPHDIHEIIEFLIEKEFKGIFVLQQYQYSEGVGPKYKEKFAQPEHLDLINLLKPYAEKNRTTSLGFKIYIRDNIIGYMELEEVLEKIL